MSGTDKTGTQSAAGASSVKANTNMFGGLKVTEKTHKRPESIAINTHKRPESTAEKPITTAEDVDVVLEAKIAKLRKQGVPEALIQKARNKYMAAKTSSSVKASTVGSDTHNHKQNQGSVESAVELKGAADQTGASISASTTVQIDGTTTGTDTTGTTGTVDAAIETLQSTLKAMQKPDQDPNTSQDASQDPVRLTNTNKGSGKGKSNKSTTKDKLKTKSKSTKAKTKAKKPKRKMQADAPVQMVRQQSRSELMESKRDPECAQK